MIFLRSLLFMLGLVVTTPPAGLVLLAMFWAPARWRRQVVMLWVHTACWMIRRLLRIDFQVRGRENIPDGPYVILSKHQSAWETIVLQQVFPLPAFVYKRELHWLPFFGWGLALMPFVAIDRGAGKDALNRLAVLGKRRLDEGYPVIIFPEGTRVAPGEKKRFKVGGAYLAVQAGAPALPVALNSGEFWGRQAFFKRPGTVTVSIGPAIDPAGLSPEEVTRRAEAWIQAEMSRISPHLYPAQEDASERNLSPS